MAAPAAAETLRIATYSPALTRKGPGLLLRDISKGNDAQIAAVVEVIASARPDILLLTSFDWDHEGLALEAFAELLSKRGLTYPHRLAPMPNRGLPTGLDLDGDGRLGSPDDAQGFGLFRGQGGMALLSNRPLGALRDHSDALWRDQPGNLMPPDTPTEVATVQRLSSSGHWDVSLNVGDETLHLLAFAAAPPAFDGPAQRNTRRNADEIAFWTRYDPGGPFVILGKVNMDPFDGGGRHEAIRALLERVTDPLPRSEGAAAAAHDPKQQGNPAFDTAEWPQEGGPGNLRVDYVLPSPDLKVSDAGVVWPAEGPLAEAARAASAHRLVWVDIEVD